jgi:hypothetical protein
MAFPKSAMELEIDEEITFKHSNRLETFFEDDSENTPLKANTEQKNTSSTKKVEIDPTLKDCCNTVRIESVLKTCASPQYSGFSKSSCRIPIGLLSAYDDDQHLPKYSQAEMDIALSRQSLDNSSEGLLQAQEWEKRWQISEEKSTQLEQQLAGTISRERNLQLQVEMLEVKLQDQLKEKKCLESAFEAEREDMTLHRTQAKALAHRLQVPNFNLFESDL